MKEIGQIIRKKRLEKNFGVAELGELAEVTHQYISNIENNKLKTPPANETLMKIADVLSMSEEEKSHLLELAALERTPDLIKEKLEKLRQKVESNVEALPASLFTKIPVFSHVLAGTDGACIYPEPEYYVDFPYVRNGSEVGAFIVKGDSMEPRIFEGDLVAVKLGVVIENGQPGVFFYNGDTIVKIYRPLPDGRIILESLNYTKYSPIQIQEYDDFKIIGKVFKVIGNW